MKNLLKNLSIFLVTGVIVLMTFNFILMPLYINARNVVVIPDLEGLTSVSYTHLTLPTIRTV